MGGVRCQHRRVVKMLREGLDISGGSQSGRATAETTSAPDRAKKLEFRGREAVEPLRGDIAPPAAQSRPSIIPNDGYIDYCYERVKKLRDTARSKEELQDGLDEILHEMARTPGRYNSMVVNLLMKHWMAAREEGTSPYSTHMKDHVAAIKTLISAWSKGKYAHMPKLKIFDASCGDGQVLEAFLDTLPPAMLKRVEVIANDISSASLDIARETLKRFQGKVKIEFTRFDITKELPNKQFDVVLLSQTLPFIVEEATLRNRRLELTMPQDENRHNTAKVVLLKTIMKRLVRPETGELLIIDEMPMKFTMSRNPDTDKAIEEQLFREVFRGVDEETVISRMKGIKSAKYLGQLKTPIDHDHEMYLMAYTKTLKKPAPEVRDDREDELRIIHSMERVHPILVQRLRDFPGNGTTPYKVIDGGGSRLVIDPVYYRDRIADNPSYWKKNGSNNLVIFRGLMHELGVRQSEDGLDGPYTRLIKNLFKSRKAEAGAAFLFIDTYPKPGGKPEPTGNTKAREFMKLYDDHQFVASFREGNNFGYLYLVAPKTVQAAEAAPEGEVPPAVNTDTEE